MVTTADDVEKLIDVTADEPVIEGRVSMIQEEGAEGDRRSEMGER